MSLKTFLSFLVFIKWQWTNYFTSITVFLPKRKLRMSSRTRILTKMMRHKESMSWHCYIGTCSKLVTKLRVLEVCYLDCRPFAQYTWENWSINSVFHLVYICRWSYCCYYCVHRIISPPPIIKTQFSMWCHFVTIITFSSVLLSLLSTLLHTVEHCMLENVIKMREAGEDPRFSRETPKPQTDRPEPPLVLTSDLVKASYHFRNCTAGVYPCYGLWVSLFSFFMTSSTLSRPLYLDISFSIYSWTICLLYLNGVLIPRIYSILYILFFNFIMEVDSILFWLNLARLL